MSSLGTIITFFLWGTCSYLLVSLLFLASLSLWAWAWNLNHQLKKLQFGWSLSWALYHLMNSSSLYIACHVAGWNGPYPGCSTEQKALGEISWCNWRAPYIHEYLFWPALPITRGHSITVKSSSIFSSIFSGPLPAPNFSLDLPDFERYSTSPKYRKVQFWISSFRFFTHHFLKTPLQ